MSRRISPQQLKILKDLVHGKRVLDVGDKQSQFLASEFAHYAKKWTIIGRDIPPSVSQILAPPENLTIIPLPFEALEPPPSPSDFDVILLPSPSRELTQDQLCLEWSSPEHAIIFLGDPQDETAFGSPGFWQLAHTLNVEREERDLWSRMLVLRKPTPTESDKKPVAIHKSHGHHPKKGERFHLVSSFRWPGKKPGERPPIVEITGDWEKASGSAKIVGTGEVLHLHQYDLGNRM